MQGLAFRQHANSPSGIVDSVFRQSDRPTGEERQRAGLLIALNPGKWTAISAANLADDLLEGLTTRLLCEGACEPMRGRNGFSVLKNPHA